MKCFVDKIFLETLLIDQTIKFNIFPRACQELTESLRRKPCNVSTATQRKLILEFPVQGKTNFCGFLERNLKTQREIFQVQWLRSSKADFVTVESRAREKCFRTTIKTRSENNSSFRRNFLACDIVMCLKHDSTYMMRRAEPSRYYSSHPNPDERKSH